MEFGGGGGAGTCHQSVDELALRLPQVHHGVCQCLDDLIPHTPLKYGSIRLPCYQMVFRHLQLIVMWKAIER